MRIFNIMLTKVDGGDAAMALRYHEALTAEGYEVLNIGHPGGPLQMALEARGEGHLFRPLRTRFVNDPIAAFQLARYTRQFKPELVLAHGNKAGRLCMLPVIGTRKKTVQVLHTASYKPHLKGANAALCVSDTVRQGAQDAFPGLKVFEMANFSHLQAGTIKSAPQGCPVIGAMGRLHEVKGFDVLLKAAARLRDAGQDFRLKIAGDGPELGALKALAASLGISDRVEFCGWATDPLAFIGGLDMFVVPSRHESFGLVVIEAMAAGVPVVASNTDGPVEVLKAGRFGRLFNNGDDGHLATALGAVFQDWPDTEAELRDAQAYAMEAFGFEAGRRRLRQTIDALV